MGDTASTGTGAYAPCTYMGMTPTTTAATASDTSLSGEYVASGGGLNRKLVAFARNSGSSFYVQTAAFTMNASDGASTTPAKYGMFNAASGGTMPFTGAIPNPPAMVPGDSIANTETVNI